MKTRFQFKSFTLIISLILFTSICFSQNYETTKSLNKTASVSENVTVKMSNYSSDLKIITTNSNTVSIATTVKIIGKSKEDVDKVIIAIENFEFKEVGDIMEIDTRFYKNMNSINNRRTITLKDGDKVRIREFKISHELQIPKSANIELSNKYSDIEMQDLEGNAKFELYSSKLHGDNITGNMDLECKYSKLYLKEILGDADFGLYDTDVEFISCKDLNIKSKYSKVNAEKVASLKLDSYDDKFNINEIDNLEFEAKYSDLVSEAELSELILNLYDSNIEIKSAKSGSFSGKYSDLKLGNVKELKIPSSYDNDIYFGKTMDIQIDESKYCTYKFGEVAELSLNGYDDNISVSKLNSEFSGISIKGKYGKLEVNTGNVPYQIYFKLKYPKIDIPESLEIIKRIKDSSELELVGNKTGGKISVEGYDMTIVIE